MAIAKFDCLDNAAPLFHSAEVLPPVARELFGFDRRSVEPLRCLLESEAKRNLGFMD